MPLLFMAGAFTFHHFDSERTTRHEFDKVSVQALSASRLRAVSSADSISKLEALLSESERKVSDHLALRGAAIKKDQSKTVVWAGSEFQTPLSLVYIHGFSASRLELEPVISDLGRRLKANIFFTRLKGHGLTDGEEFPTVRARDWASDVDEALAIGERIGRRVILIGMSTGAALAMDGYLRATDSQSASSVIGGLILLSPNYGLKDFGGFLLEGSIGPFMARWILGTHREFESLNPLHGERWTTKYRTEGLPAMMTAVARAHQIDVSTWKLPVLTVYTKRDDVVSVAEIEKISRRFKNNSTLVDWPLAERHQLASAAFNPEAASKLSDLVYEWIQRSERLR